MLLCKWHNYSGAGFPRSDGRLPSPPGPTLRDANRDFQGLPIRCCANIRRGVLQREPPARSVGDCRRPFVFRFFGQSRLFPAGSRCGCSFSSGSQSKFFFLAAFGSTFLCGQFSQVLARKRQIYPHNPSELGAPRPATPYQAPTPSGRYTHITRQSSALHAPLLLTRPPLPTADIPT